MKCKRYRQDGFTLIEIMVVIAILGLLAVLVTQGIRGAMDKAKRVKAQSDIAELKTALDRFYLDNGSYPKADQGLNALVAGGYVPSIPPDPWGNPYLYQSDGNNYELSSSGLGGNPSGGGGQSAGGYQGAGNGQ